MKQILKFIGGIFSFALMIISFAFLIFIVVLSFNKKIIRPNTIENYIESVNVLELPAHDILGTNYKETETVLDAISDNFYQNGVPKNVTKEILTSPELKSIVSTYTSNLINSVINDTELTEFTRENFDKIISKEKINSVLDVPLSSTDEQKVDQYINETIKEMNEAMKTDVEAFKKDKNNSETIKYLQILNSKETKIIIIVLAIAMFLLFALFTFSLYKPFIWLSIPTFILGLLLTIGYFCRNILIKYISSGSSLNSAVSNFVNAVLKDLLYYGLILIGFSIVMFTIYSVFKKKANNPKVHKKEISEEDKEIREKKKEIKSKNFLDDDYE